MERMSTEDSRARRVKAIQMIQDGKIKAHIAEELGVSRAAVTQWWNSFMKGGDEALQPTKKTGRRRKLSQDELAKLPELLAKGAMSYGFYTDLWTTKRIKDLIIKEFGIKYNRNHIAKLLHQLHLSWQKPAKKAYERDEKVIKTWISETWPALKKKQRRPKQR